MLSIILSIQRTQVHCTQILSTLFTCLHVHRRTGNFLPGGGGNPFAQKILASCPNFYKPVERKLGPCNKIGRTGIWKWLDTVFQSQYLPSLSRNYVATNKHLEKIAITVVLDKEGNLSWSGLQIWHRSCHSYKMTPCLLYLQQYFSLELFLQNRSGEGALSSNRRLDVREVKTEL